MSKSNPDLDPIAAAMRSLSAEDEQTILSWPRRHPMAAAFPGFLADPARNARFTQILDEELADRGLPPIPRPHHLRVVDET